MISGFDACTPDPILLKHYPDTNFIRIFSWSAYNKKRKLRIFSQKSNRSVATRIITKTHKSSSMFNLKERTCKLLSIQVSQVQKAWLGRFPYMWCRCNKTLHKTRRKPVSHCCYVFPCLPNVHV